MLCRSCLCRSFIFSCVIYIYIIPYEIRERHKEAYPPTQLETSYEVPCLFYSYSNCNCIRVTVLLALLLLDALDETHSLVFIVAMPIVSV